MMLAIKYEHTDAHIIAYGRLRISNVDIKCKAEFNKSQDFFYWNTNYLSELWKEKEWNNGWTRNSVSVIT